MHRWFFNYKKMWKIKNKEKKRKLNLINDLKLRVHKDEHGLNKNDSF